MKGTGQLTGRRGTLRVGTRQVLLHRNNRNKAATLCLLVLCVAQNWEPQKKQRDECERDLLVKLTTAPYPGTRRVGFPFGACPSQIRQWRVLEGKPRVHLHSVTSPLLLSVSNPSSNMQKNEFLLFFSSSPLQIGARRRLVRRAA